MLVLDEKNNFNFTLVLFFSLVSLNTMKYWKAVFFLGHKIQFEIDEIMKFPLPTKSINNPRPEIKMPIEKCGCCGISLIYEIQRVNYAKHKKECDIR